MKDKDTGIIHSLDKGLFLLEVIEEAGSPVTLQKLWQKLRWDKATIHRLLATLERRGYVCRESTTKGYILGMKIYGLYNSLIKNLDIQTATRPYLARLVRETGETAHLAVPVEKNIVFIDRIAGSGILSVNTQLGGREPVHCTALGKAYLAFVDGDALANLLDEPLLGYTPKTIVTARSLREELERVKRNGYAVDNEEYMEGIRCIGAPILNELGAPIATIGISGPKYRLPLGKCAEYGKLVCRLSLEVSRRFGFSGKR